MYPGLSRCSGKSSEHSPYFCRVNCDLGCVGAEQQLYRSPINSDQLGCPCVHVCTQAHVHVCWARKWHVLGGAYREALGWIPTVGWLWFHTSFPDRPGEAKLHRWPSGWHFRIWPSAHSQPSPSPTLLCSSGSVDSAEE